MSSELVKKMEAEYEKIDADVEDERHPNWQSEHKKGFLMGLDYALNIVETHEAQQMKEPIDKSSKAALEQAKDIYLRSNANWELIIYGIDKHSQANKLHVISRLAEWAIEQEKMEEEEA